MAEQSAMSREAHTAVRANVRVHLTNPDSGYESETTGKVTADEWAVIDAILCGRGTVYPAAPALLEALQWLVETSEDPDSAHQGRALDNARAAIHSATGEG